MSRGKKAGRARRGCSFPWFSLLGTRGQAALAFCMLYGEIGRPQRYTDRGRYSREGYREPAATTAVSYGSLYVMVVGRMKRLTKNTRDLVQERG